MHVRLGIIVALLTFIRTMHPHGRKKRAEKLFGLWSKKGMLRPLHGQFYRTILWKLGKKVLLLPLCSQHHPILGNAA